ncbi:alpha/beta fold hydrolase [Frankia sp. AgKG'84/4]|uniref:alpha/beta fold hydrolase n=1 Tax=Frankia sp. AgKG'84/4 TaxID=573490 RepID=UPI00200C1467|nr:alpha/beta fold hydrolase [Frankia sp. AgKG'84/4]MCL9796697.1 alpha/beta fold hydrolase [Frankia sp. AgKG'84/4]
MVESPRGGSELRSGARRGSSSGFWDLLVPRLARPALAVDLPGRAGRPADPMALTVEDCVASVLADVEAAGLPDVVLVAHSSGCFLVPGIVERLGARVRHIVLTPPCVPPEGGFGLDAMKPSYARRARAGLAAARRDGTALTTPGPPADPEVLRRAYVPSARPGPRHRRRPGHRPHSRGHRRRRDRRPSRQDRDSLRRLTHPCS